MIRLIAAAGSAIDRIKVNELSRSTQDGRSVWVKRRRPGSLWILRLANVFFRAAKNPVRVLSDSEEWQRWELDSFRALHGERYWISATDHSVCAEAVPGRSLSDLLNNRELTTAMCAAAGRELRRAHGIYSATFQSEWSHGDPHLGNFIYSFEEGCTRLIDFEVMHHPSMSPDQRHADDLLVFLLDLCGRSSKEEWLSLGLAFVNGYGVSRVQQNLKNRLQLPGGIAGLWWSIRSTYMPRPELARRLAALRNAL